MRPLQPIALGLLVLFVHAGRYDLLPDPIGWVVVLAGLSALPETFEHKRVLLGLAGLAGAISVPLWWPAWADALNNADPSLWWAANLPQLGFVILLCVSIVRVATRAEDANAARWWQVSATMATLAAVLPVIVFGGGVAGLELPTYLLGALTLLTVVILGFAHAGRAWAKPEEPSEPR